MNLRRPLRVVEGIKAGNGRQMHVHYLDCAERLDDVARGLSGGTWAFYAFSNG